jgi:cellulose synthase/poly-beta-1,6-N-acetylglucosamine synthase-like glycosyltransferase
MTRDWTSLSVEVARTSGDQTAAQPFVSVVVPHYNDIAGLRLCHERLLAQTWPADRFELIVADNNSRCGLDAVRAVAPTAKVVLETAQGAGPARNAGVAASRGEVLAFLDSDCVPEPDWIAEGVAALQRHDFVGGQVFVLARVPERPTPVEAFEIVFNFNFRRYIEQVGFTGTGNMFVRRDVFDRVGGFRTGVSEDMDWSFRARALGYTLGYAERAVVGHPARRDWPELIRRWSRIVAEHYETAREHRAGRIAFIGKALLMPFSIPPHAADVLRSDKLPDARARAGAIQILTRLRLWRARQMLRLALQRKRSLPRAGALEPSPGGPGQRPLDQSMTEPAGNHAHAEE